MSRVQLAMSLISALVFGAAAQAQTAQPVMPGQIFRSGLSYHVRACSGPIVAGQAQCHAHLVTDRVGHPLRVMPVAGRLSRNAAPAVSGGPYTPAELRAAYNITAVGSGATVAIVDAYGYPNAASDLANFRSEFGLGSCTTSNGCLRIVNETGGTKLPASNAGWDEEQALDLDMVSTMCPDCKILLVEANSSSYGDLATAVNEAAALGAHSIGNSYGGGESGSQSYESAYNHSGVAVTASAGDSGYGVEFPASSPHVTAVGGTSLVWTGSSRTEYVWSGTGSGCSAVYGEPTWQAPGNPGMGNNTMCLKRMVNDVSAVADPDTGVIVYMNIRPYQPGFYIFGGTSASAQIISGIYGAQDSGVNYGSNPYAALSAINNVTSGSNGSCSVPYFCNGEVGYNGPTGLGTPNGSSGF
ncbi:MAG TPA: S53 family peptidase [Caulobacteraceae bacterium]|nr:S53 family peptidase [Caulobacteraceae bacterium]